MPNGQNGILQYITIHSSTRYYSLGSWIWAPSTFSMDPMSKMLHLDKNQQYSNSSVFFFLNKFFMAVNKAKKEHD